MKSRPKPKLVFVHGIGKPFEPREKLAQWKRALAEGMRDAHLAPDISALTMDWMADCSLAYYGDLFTDGEPQGAGGPDDLDEEEAALVLGFLAEFLEEEAARPENQGDRALARLSAQLSPDGQPQGAGGAGRRLAGLLTAAAAVPGLAQVARWSTARDVLRTWSQPARYLRRGDKDDQGTTLDARIRAQVLDCLDSERPTVVVGHSLGSVVAFEALKSYQGPVPLLVTIGSPIATSGLVWPRLRPRPPATPDCVDRWLDFWDGDDVVVPRRKLADLVRPNERGVAPTPLRFDSRRWWAHGAETYLARAEVAEPVIRALRAASTGTGIDADIGTGIGTGIDRGIETGISTETGTDEPAEVSRAAGSAGASRPAGS
ncbi:alpha/beta hydrolase [Streptomyces sp. CWNU-52B]|uniref:alpha/beta hydrolase n=1 Tax=unclassified Streptomyces TaxID=2593676 RepID=UPI0039C08424